MKIRMIKKREIEDAIKIIHQNYPEIDKEKPKKEIMEMFGKALIKPVYLVAEENKKILGIAGYIQSFQDYNIYEIFWVNVAKEKQGNGIGTKLVKSVIKRIRGIKGELKKAELIELTTTKPQFYEKKFGFKLLSTFGNKEYLMGLVLK